MENDLSNQIIGAAIEAHKTLGGPGLLESVYEEALCFELSRMNLPYQRQLAVPIIYKNNKFSNPYFLDLIVKDQIIIEIKAVEKVLPIHKTQLLTYLRLKKKKLGLLINFGAQYVGQDIKRVVNDF